jgi:hypothetical protein
VDAKLVVEGFELGSGKRVLHDTKDIGVRPHCSTELLRLEVPNGRREGEDVVVAAQLIDDLGEVLSRTFAWPEP